MSKTYDITLPISAGMVTWPGDPNVVLERVNKIEEGANANVSKVAMSVHTGTHVDAPYHFLQEGKTVEALDLDILIGQTWVVELPEDCKTITAEVIEKAGIAAGTKRVLFKTRNSNIWVRGEKTFQTDFVGIPLDGAQALVKLGLKLVGIDYLSISPYKNSRPTHEALLKAGLVVVEGLDLSRVPAGCYQMVCLPLKLQGSDGAPTRVILME